jgi:hypothetical protein
MAAGDVVGVVAVGVQDRVCGLLWKSLEPKVFAGRTDFGLDAVDEGLGLEEG